LLNGRISMISFVIASIVYLKTGQLLPGIWWLNNNTWLVGAFQDKIGGQKCPPFLYK
jgi:hypothetical protein